MQQDLSASSRLSLFSSDSAEDSTSYESAPNSLLANPLTAMRHLKLLAFLTVVSTLIGTTAILASRNRSWLAGEDSLVENLSVIFFLLAFFVAIFRCVRNSFGNHQIGWLPGVAVLGLVGALEELSYGQRILEFGVPRIAGVEFDALHDFTNVAYEMLKQSYTTNTALFATIGAGCVGLLGYCAVRYGSKTISIVKNSQPLLILTFLVSLIFVAVVIDLEIFDFSVLRVYEEIFEMNAAFAAFLLSLVVSKSVLKK